MNKPVNLVFLAPGFIAMVGFNCYVGRHIPKMLDLLLQKGKFNKKFKQIFDNLDETILIINNSNQSIEYMNKFFFIQFKEIIESLESQADSEDLERYNKFIEIPIFVIYQAKDPSLMSIKDITQF